MPRPKNTGFSKLPGDNVTDSGTSLSQHMYATRTSTAGGVLLPSIVDRRLQQRPAASCSNGLEHLVYSRRLRAGCLQRGGDQEGCNGNDEQWHACCGLPFHQPVKHACLPGLFDLSLLAPYFVTSRHHRCGVPCVLAVPVVAGYVAHHCSDDCWASWKRPNNTITWDPDRFPSGIPALTSWLHERQLKFGLYTSAGTFTCSSGTRPHKIPGSLYRYEADAKAFADWEVDCK
eukprot:COSAG02_NODE_3351_length_6887_cov_19.626547_3_plen_231_part_00